MNNGTNSSTTMMVWTLGLKEARADSPSTQKYPERAMLVGYLK